jgi:CheY-like chemotaxis protein
MPIIAQVLLVENDETARSTLAEVLGAGGFAVTFAANTAEALESISSGKYDVLLSSLRMATARGGPEVLKAARHANPRVVTLLFGAFPPCQER